MSPADDINRALRLCLATARKDEYRGIGYQRTLGYVPCDVKDPYNNDNWSLSRTLEYAFDDACIARANQRYMGCTGPTNVLSFPGDESLPGVMLLSLDTLNRECLLYGQDPAEHLLRLLAHSVGHLAGYDHGEEMDALCVWCRSRAEAEVWS